MSKKLKNQSKRPSIIFGGITSDHSFLFVSPRKSRVMKAIGKHKDAPSIGFFQCRRCSSTGALITNIDAQFSLTDHHVKSVEELLDDVFIKGISLGEVCAAVPGVREEIMIL